MATPGTTGFLAGVIEGFYGKPWTHAERLEVLDWMAASGLNTYVYAPKDDSRHRAIWRQLYLPDQGSDLAELIRASEQRKIHFFYALAPGLDLRYSNPEDLDQLKRRFDQMLALGCRHFSLLFDDIPDHLSSADLARWSSLASAQSHIANTLFHWIRERSPIARFLFCPTPYCSRMATAGLGGDNYLVILGRELLPGIDVFWTGPEIISRELEVNHVEDIGRVLGRKPVIWDNLYANDYDGRRFYCGPYAGRPVELRNGVNGLLCNPNCEAPLNFVPLLTLAGYLNAGEVWDARDAYISAVREWSPAFETYGLSIDPEDLVLFLDCFYLPYQEGDQAEQLYRQAWDLLARNSESSQDEATLFLQRTQRLRKVCLQLSELRNRPLFHALSRRIWDLREEIELLERYVKWKLDPVKRHAPFHSDFHLPGTYRGGMISRLQELLWQGANGEWRVANGEEMQARRSY